MLDDNDKKEIAGLIKEAMSEVTQEVAAIQGSTTEQINGVVAKFNKKFSTQFKNIEEKIQPLFEVEGSEEGGEVKEQGRQGQQKVSDKQGDEWQQELASVKKELEEQKQQLEKERQESINLRKQQDLVQQRNAFTNGFSGKVVDPDAFFTLAQTQGFIKQGTSENGGVYYYLEETDKYGETSQVRLDSPSAINLASNYLKTSLPYLEPPRPGGGASVENSGNPSVNQGVVGGQELQQLILSGDPDKALTALEKTFQ